jgi:hypothetical protein
VFDLLQGLDKVVGESRGGGGGSRIWAAASVGARTPSKNPPPFQEYKHIPLTFLVANSPKLHFALAEF